MNPNLFLQWAAEKVRQQKNFILEAKKKTPTSPGGGAPRWGPAEEAKAKRKEAAAERKENNTDADEAKRLLAKVRGAAELQAAERMGVGQKEPLPSTSMEAGSNLDFLRNLGIDAGYMASRSPVKSERHNISSSAEALGMQEEYQRVIESEETKESSKEIHKKAKSHGIIKIGKKKKYK